MEYIAWIAANGLEFVGAVYAALMALAAVFLMIPGEQPEKAILSVAKFLERFSKK